MEKAQTFDKVLKVRISAGDRLALDAVAEAKGTDASKMIRDFVARAIKRHAAAMGKSAGGGNG